MSKVNEMVSLKPTLENEDKNTLPMSIEKNNLPQVANQGTSK